MKVATLVVRILLGLAFFASGIIGVLHLAKTMPPMPPDALTLTTIMMASGWMKFVYVLMMIGGLLLMVGRFVPLALVILGPILVNILLFHIFLEGGSGIIPGLVLTVLELYLIFAYRFSFRGLFDAAPEVS